MSRSNAPDYQKGTARVVVLGQKEKPVEVAPAKPEPMELSSENMPRFYPVEFSGGEVVNNLNGWMDAPLMLRAVAYTFWLSLQIHTVNAPILLNFEGRTYTCVMTDNVLTISPNNDAIASRRVADTISLQEELRHAQNTLNSQSEILHTTMETLRSNEELMMAFEMSDPVKSATYRLYAESSRANVEVQQSVVDGHQETVSEIQGRIDALSGSVPFEPGYVFDMRFAS